MAISWVREDGDGTGGGIDEKGVRSYKRTFKVLTTSLDDGTLTVRTANTVPRVGDIYYDRNGALDTGARCKNVDVDRDSNNWYLWHVTASYDSAPWDTQDRDRQEVNPLLRRAKVSFGSAGKREARDVDADGNDVLNSAGDPFDPPVEVDKHHLVMRVEKNFPGFDPLVIVTHKNSVNANRFFGFPPETVLLVDLSADEEEESGFTFWKVKYVFEFSTYPETWETLILDAGYNAVYDLPVVGPKKLNVTDAKGQKHSKPVLLDGAGQVLSQADLDAGGPVYLHFMFFPRRDFSVLGL